MFKGRHFDQSVILLCVRWYLAYNLSLRDLEGDDGRARHQRRPFDGPSLWTALPLQVDFELIRVARCKHLSGVIR